MYSTFILSESGSMGDICQLKIIAMERIKMKKTKNPVMLSMRPNGERRKLWAYEEVCRSKKKQQSQSAEFGITTFTIGGSSTTKLMLLMGHRLKMDPFLGDIH
jgi:hypothetical protein